MYRTMIARLAGVMLTTASACLTTASLAATPMACGQAPTSAKREVPLASMRTPVPLYVMQANGRLVKMDLRTGSVTTLADHGFGISRDVHISGNGRWLGYSGVPKGGNTTQYWLYDRQTQSERLMHEHPPFGSGMPSFSPDSRYFVISAWYDSRWPNASRAGIYLFDTTTMRLELVPVSLVTANKALGISPTWSQDGKALLIMVRTAWNKDGFAYFSYDLATRRIETVAGRYDMVGYRHEFWRGGQRIPAFQEFMPRSALAERAAWSPGHSWRAHTDERPDDPNYQLLVTDKKGVSTPVAAGHYEKCAGETLFISGWLDEHLLVYRNAMDYFVFDALAGTTAELFSKKDMPVTFTW